MFARTSTYASGSGSQDPQTARERASKAGAGGQPGGLDGCPPQRARTHIARLAQVVLGVGGRGRSSLSGLGLPFARHEAVADRLNHLARAHAETAVRPAEESGRIGAARRRASLSSQMLSCALSALRVASACAAVSHQAHANTPGDARVPRTSPASATCSTLRRSGLKKSSSDSSAASPPLLSAAGRVGLP